MSWREVTLTLHLAAEERVGVVMRDRERMRRSIEDAAWAKARDVAEQMGG